MPTRQHTCAKLRVTCPSRSLEHLDHVLVGGDDRREERAADEDALVANRELAVVDSLAHVRHELDKLEAGEGELPPLREALPKKKSTANQSTPFGLHWCLSYAWSILQYDVSALMGLKKSRTVPMSSTMNSVLVGMALHASAQYALLASVVPGTSAISDIPVFGGRG